MFSFSFKRLLLIGLVSLLRDGEVDAGALSIPRRQIGSVGSFGGRKKKKSPPLRSPSREEVGGLGFSWWLLVGTCWDISSSLSQFCVWSMLKPCSGLARNEMRLVIKVKSVRVDDTVRYKHLKYLNCVLSGKRTLCFCANTIWDLALFSSKNLLFRAFFLRFLTFRISFCQPPRRAAVVG